MDIQLALRLPRDAASVPVIRRLMDAALAVLGADTHSRTDIQLMLTEACTNVIKHARESDEYTVQVDIVDERCVIKVLDTGGGFDPGRTDGTPPAPTSENGRGLLIMKALADDVRFTVQQDHGAIVRLEKCLRFAEDTPGHLLAG
ncbi:ATP-binding protein [Actinomadura craniellae]|uniref:ATP-binding protein n=1 Tax=Actinomadura craniellae TaxID=2231787 RepID=A0A365HEJ0_9ACTN|nr:ATP-binding protein [Actinomadura craniellae]RAY16633.1 ATP-binding protein [Actinomadura craniellae]